MINQKSTLKNKKKRQINNNIPIFLIADCFCSASGVYYNEVFISNQPRKYPFL